MRYLYLCAVGTGPSRCGDRRLPGRLSCTQGARLTPPPELWMRVVDVGGWRIHEREAFMWVDVSAAIKFQKSDLDPDFALAAVPEPFALSVPWLYIIGWRRWHSGNLGLNFSPMFSSYDAKNGLFMLIDCCFFSFDCCMQTPFPLSDFMKSPVGRWVLVRRWSLRRLVGFVSMHFRPVWMSVIVTSVNVRLLLKCFRSKCLSSLGSEA